MSNQEFFPQRSNSHPMIYAYSENNPKYEGLLKIGYTERDVEHRVAQQYPTKRPDGISPYEIVLAESAMRSDGSCFFDHEIHRVLEKKRVIRVGGEWFRCTVEDVKAAIIAVKTRTENEGNRTSDFRMRPEQKEAVEKTIEYFTDIKKEAPERSGKFLWNAKMRFGKTFAAYQLVKQMNMQRVLVLTFKPAVEAAWEEDLKTHVDFEGWQFICRGGLNY
ncbi:GIY-YIG nuclease family protein [Trichococcus flocculiformis]|uniref:GIY-YIG nuclease family protein n=1 Tax=Trichococcus flocculiformis TaxID=82803 RepID=UPI0023EFDF0B|nr:GIY-YIG nuclease family protein [Trichococcus flocculiformis]